MEIKKLTSEEIQTLQNDAALRLIGEYSNLLADVNQSISQAIIKLGNAKIELDCLKNDKQTLVEMIRALKVIAERP